MITFRQFLENDDHLDKMLGKHVDLGFKDPWFAKQFPSLGDYKDWLTEKLGMNMPNNGWHVRVSGADGFDLHFDFEFDVDVMEDPDYDYAGPKKVSFTLPIEPQLDSLAIDQFYKETGL